MAISTILEILHQAADELGIDRPSSVTATDDLSRQFTAHANRIGRDLVRAHEWSALRTVKEQVLVDGTASYAVPDDFHRFIEGTQWDSTNNWRLLGPDSPQTGRWRRESEVAQTGPRRAIQLAGSNILVWPTPTSADTLTYEYISKKWCLSSAVYYDTIQADADTTVYDPDVMVAGIKWRFRAAKGLDAEASGMEYQLLLREQIAADIPRRDLNLAPASTPQLISTANVPDAGYGS